MKYNFAEAGERVRKLRKGAKLSQAAFLEKLSERGVDIARNRLSGLENGVQKSFSLDILLAAADIFGCDVGYILGEFEESTRELHDLAAATGLDEQSLLWLQKVSSYNIGDSISLPVENGGTVHSLVCCEYDKPLYTVNLLLHNPQILGLIHSYLSVINEDGDVYGGDKSSTVLFELMFELKKLRVAFQPAYKKAFEAYFKNEGEGKNGKH